MIHLTCNIYYTFNFNVNQPIFFGISRHPHFGNFGQFARAIIGVCNISAYLNLSLLSAIFKCFIRWHNCVEKLIVKLYLYTLAYIFYKLLNVFVIIDKCICLNWNFLLLLKLNFSVKTFSNCICMCFQRRYAQIILNYLVRSLHILADLNRSVRSLQKLEEEKYDLAFYSEPQTSKRKTWSCILFWASNIKLWFKSHGKSFIKQLFNMKIQTKQKVINLPELLLQQSKDRRELLSTNTFHLWKKF